jgi:hypothetical protein
VESLSSQVQYWAMGVSGQCRVIHSTDERSSWANQPLRCATAFAIAGLYVDLAHWVSGIPSVGSTGVPCRVGEEEDNRGKAKRS